MKWTKSLSIALLLAASLTALTSCDDHPWDYRDYYGDWYDDYNWYDDSFNYGNSTLNAEAAALRGYWEGQIENRYYENGQLKAVAMKATFEFDQYNTNSLNGRGRETDYLTYTDDDGVERTETNELRFAWYIDPRTGDICLKYDGSGMTYSAAWEGGFSLDTQTNRFYGVFEGQNNQEQIVFDLTRTTLAKPNTEFGGTDTAATGAKFGTMSEGGVSITAPAQFRRR